MEIPRCKIEKFLEIEYSNGCIYGGGYGEGKGFGCGKGSGNGFSYGEGNGDGSGNGDGYSDYYGMISNIIKFNNKNVYIIDGIATIITQINKNIAKGFILNDDFITTNCYIAKYQNKFAHGKTLKQAVQSLREKIYEKLDTEEAISKFRNEFKKGYKYKADKFYLWHHILTGSCEMGRKNFAKNHNIDLDKDKFTVKEFIEICENDYGGEIIKELKNFY